MWAAEGNADIYLNDCYSELVTKGNQPDNLDNLLLIMMRDGIIHHTTGKKVLLSLPQIITVYGVNPLVLLVCKLAWYYTKIRKINTFIAKITENKANYSDAWYNKRMDEASS